jgi:hypothetical protein
VVDAYALFLHARSAVTAAQYPQRIDYTIAVTGLDGQIPRTNHYRADTDVTTNEVRVFSMSEEELAAPAPVPHGFNVNLSAFLCGGRCETGSVTVHEPVGPAPRAFDLIGVPKLSPVYAFGLAFPHYGGSSTIAESTLPTIAVVSTKTRDYDVAIVDTPSIDGIPTYHLRLTPLRKPKDNRLRELWIGVTDYLPRRAVVSGNFTLAPLVDVPWTIDFVVRDGAPYVAREAAGATLYLPHRRVVRDAAIAFENVDESDGSFLHRPLIEPENDDYTLSEPLY